MNNIKKFFNITKPYTFEKTDIEALITILNVIGVITIGLTASWIGLGMAIFNLITNFKNRPHINVWLIHISLLVLNGYFLGLLYHLF